MKVVRAAGPGEMQKFLALAKAFQHIWSGQVLDVGSRSGNLRHVLTDYPVDYCGVDLAPPATIIANLEDGLPFRDRAFDVVVALDVLEHTDDIHGAFKELCRVADTHVLVSMPNGYDITARLRFLSGKRLSGKYGLPPVPPNDRHRWLFSWREAQEFVSFQSRTNGFEVAAVACLMGPRRGWRLGRILAQHAPDLWAPWHIALAVRRRLQ